MAGTFRARVFVALTLDDRSSERLASIAAGLRSSPLAPRATWVIREDLHLTLKFLGNVERGRIPAIGAVIHSLAQGLASPVLRMKGVGAFPSRSRARVVVVDFVDVARKTGSLAAEMDSRFATLGFSRERRAFVPHVTLARVRDDVDARKWLDFAIVEAGDASVATSLVLYESHLSPKGSSYAPLVRADLPR